MKIFSTILFFICLLGGSLKVYAEDTKPSMGESNDITILQKKKTKPICRSMIVVPQIQAWQYKTYLEFCIDRSVGETQVEVYTEAKEKIQGETIEILGGVIYRVPLSDLPAGKYFLFLVLSDYQEMEFYGNFDVY